MEKKYIVRYQGGSGGFLVAWLLQMTVQSDCFDSALQCFHHSLKNNPIQWKNYEITPPNIAVLCNSFAPDYVIANYQERINSFLIYDLEKIINNDIRIDSDWTLQKVLKAYLINEIFKKVLWNVFDENIDNLSINVELLEEIKKYNALLYTNSKNLLITAPQQFIKIANQTKAGTANGEIKYCGLDDSNYINYSATFNKYKDKLNLFPIESVWKGDWQDYIEKFIGKKLTPHQSHRCLTIISRWLEIQPTEIKKYINL